MLGMQRPDGHVEYYGEGNFNRTALLYAYMQSQGVRPEHWQPGMAVGAVRDGDQLILDLTLPSPTRIQFDYARHTRAMNLDKNYVRLNEFPEWFVVDENTLYRLHKDGATGEDAIRLGFGAGRGRDNGAWALDGGADGTRAVREAVSVAGLKPCPTRTCSADLQVCPTTRLQA